MPLQDRALHLLDSEPCVCLVLSQVILFFLSFRSLLCHRQNLSLYVFMCAFCYVSQNDTYIY